MEKLRMTLAEAGYPNVRLEHIDGPWTSSLGVWMVAGDAPLKVWWKANAVVDPGLSTCWECYQARVALIASGAPRPEWDCLRRGSALGLDDCGRDRECD
jgi:hypothetical protein